MFENLVDKLKKTTRTLVFTEGTDPRILEAASRLKRDRILAPLLLGVREEVEAAACQGGFHIEGITIVDPARYHGVNEMAEQMAALRKGKMTVQECRQALTKSNYFGTMLVKMGRADALLGGATYSTADTVRPALQLIKTKPGSKSVSSCFIMVRENSLGEEEKYVMGDCAININPTAEEMAECALSCAATAKIFDIEPKVAMLSYSTKGSGKGEDVDKVRMATELAKSAAPDLDIDGELQFDAAFSPEVARTKCGDSPVAGHANVFIFPEIQSGNIGYKIAQRLGGFVAVGPILQGLNAPINDLSRGCDAQEVYELAIITAALI